MIIDVENPIPCDNKIVFPGVALDKILIDNSILNPLYEYATEVIRLHNIISISTSRTEKIQVHQSN